MTLKQTGMETDFKKRQHIMISGKYSEMKDVLYAYIIKRIDDPQEAEDILHEAFTRLLESDTIISVHTFDRFIYRTVRNLVTDWYRRHAYSLRAQEYFSLFNASASCTENEVDFREMLSIEQGCIRKMGRRQAEIYMRYIHGGSDSAELSRMLNLSRRTVENHVFAARKSLREAFRHAI